MSLGDRVRTAVRNFLNISTDNGVSINIHQLMDHDAEVFKDRIEKAISRNLVKTADALKTDLQQSETMPFKTGQLQNRSTFIDDKEAAVGKVYIVSDTPYARRLYFHPEYNFNRTENKAAGGAWFEPYISGQKKDYAKRVFAKFMQRSCGG